jgi:hypothetical protein
MDRGDQANHPRLQTSPPAQAEGYLPQQAAVPRRNNGSQAKTDTDATPRPTTSSTEKDGFDDATTSGEESLPRREKSDPYGRTGGVTIAPPPRARSIRDGGVYRQGETVMSPSRRRGSGLDWVVPAVDEEKPYVVCAGLLVHWKFFFAKAYFHEQPRLRSVGERLQPTLDHAHREKVKFERKG